VRFLIDQALSPAVAIELNLAGHDAVHVRELGMQAASDDEIFDHAAQDDRCGLVGWSVLAAVSEQDHRRRGLFAAETVAASIELQSCRR
jgi:hypothetical protein